MQAVTILNQLCGSWADRMLSTSRVHIPWNNFPTFVVPGNQNSVAVTMTKDHPQTLTMSNIKETHAAHFLYDWDLMLEEDTNLTDRDLMAEYFVHKHCNKDAVRFHATWANIEHPETVRKIFDMMGNETVAPIFVVLSETAIRQIHKSDSDALFDAIQEWTVRWKCDGEDGRARMVSLKTVRIVGTWGNAGEELFPNQVHFIPCESLKANLADFQERWKRYLGLRKIQDANLPQELCLTRTMASRRQHTGLEYTPTKREREVTSNDAFLR